MLEYTLQRSSDMILPLDSSNPLQTMMFEHKDGQNLFNSDEASFTGEKTEFTTPPQCQSEVLQLMTKINIKHSSHNCAKIVLTNISNHTINRILKLSKYLQYFVVKSEYWNALLVFLQDQLLVEGDGWKLISTLFCQFSGFENVDRWIQIQQNNVKVLDKRRKYYEFNCILISGFIV